MSFTFHTATFEMLVEDRITPVWTPVVEATDRKLIGTAYVERNWRHTVWVFDGVAWIPPGPTATLSFDALRWAYQTVFLSTWTHGDESHLALVVGFQMQARYNGHDGYEGQLTFMRPGG